jgi:hypothetical protein
VIDETAMIFSTPDQQECIRELKSEAEITVQAWDNILKNHLVKREEDLTRNHAQWAIEDLQELKTDQSSTHAG